MHAKLQRRVQRYGWDKAAGSYEGYWGDQLAPAQSRLLALAALQKGERVLDVACGTGLVTMPAAESVGSTGVVVGTDISDEMVTRGRVMAARADVRHARFERMDGEDLRFSEGSFDAAMCALGLMYFPDPVRSLCEMRRVLAPGGRAAVAVWGQRARCGWASIFPIVDSRVRSDVCPLFFRLGTGDTLERSMEEAGFAAILCERLDVTLSYESDEDALGAAFVGGPVALAYSRFDECTRREAHAEYLTSIAPYRNGRGYDIPGEFVVAVGSKAA